MVFFLKLFFLMWFWFWFDGSVGGVEICGSDNVLVGGMVVV